MYGKAKKRSQHVLDHAEDNFNLKTLITETNLKCVGFLSKRVGTLCKYQKFKGGKPLPSLSNKEGDVEENKLVTIDKDRRIDLGKGTLYIH